MEPDRSPQSNGWVERTLLNYLAIYQGNEVRSRAAGMQDVHATLKQMAKKTGNQSPKNESIYRSGHRAFHELAAKGLVEQVEDATNLSSDKYTVSAGYRPDDARLTEWVLTPAGFDEIRQLDQQYESELDNLMRRFGRWGPTLRLSE